MKMIRQCKRANVKSWPETYEWGHTRWDDIILNP